MISKSRRDSTGGGVVAEFSRDLQEPTWFSGGGGGSSRIFPGSPVAKSKFYPTLSDIRWLETHILLKYDQNSHFLRKNSVHVKFPQFRHFSLQFRETWRSRPISGDSRKFRETWQVWNCRI